MLENIQTTDVNQTDTAAEQQRQDYSRIAISAAAEGQLLEAGTPLQGRQERRRAVSLIAVAAATEGILLEAGTPQKLARKRITAKVPKELQNVFTLLVERDSSLLRGTALLDSDMVVAIAESNELDASQLSRQLNTFQKKLPRWKPWDNTR
jgi:hypothetical protein